MGPAVFYMLLFQHTSILNRATCPAYIHASAGYLSGIHPFLTGLLVRHISMLQQSASLAHLRFFIFLITKPVITKTRNNPVTIHAHVFLTLDSAHIL